MDGSGRARRSAQARAGFSLVSCSRGAVVGPMGCGVPRERGCAWARVSVQHDPKRSTWCRRVMCLRGERYIIHQVKGVGGENRVCGGREFAMTMVRGCA